MSTFPTTSDVLPPPPPPGLNYIAAIKPSLNLLLIGTVWSAFLVPTAIALFFFSTPHVRRRPVFILNVIAIILGLTEGALIVYGQGNYILAKPVSANAFTAHSALTALIPMLTESILLVRLFAVYPPSQLSWKYRLLVYGPIAIFKVARLINNIIFVYHWQRADSTFTTPLQAGEAVWAMPWGKIEWSLQLADNTYTSALFLLRLRKAAKGISTSTNSQRSSYSDRLRTLFWIAASNFVFPVILSLAQLIFVLRDTSFLDGTYIFTVNNYVEIIGVLLATIWSTGTQWSDSPNNSSRAQGNHIADSLSLPQFALGKILRPPRSVTMLSATEVENFDSDGHPYDVTLKRFDEGKPERSPEIGEYRVSLVGPLTAV